MGKKYKVKPVRDKEFPTIAAAADAAVGDTLEIPESAACLMIDGGEVKADEE